MLVSTVENKRCARLLAQAIKQSGIVNADVLSLTTTAGLITIATSARGDYYTTEHRKRVKKAFEAGVSFGILTNTNVAAADTVAGLYALCTAIDADATKPSNLNAQDQWYN